MNIKNNLVYTIIAVALCAANVAMAGKDGKKKNQKEDFEQIIREQQARNKKVEQQKLEEKKKLEQQIALKKKDEEERIKKHPSMKDFKVLFPSADLVRKDDLRKYADWLKDLRTYYSEQDSFLKKCVEYGQRYADGELAKVDFYLAWGDSFVLLPNQSYLVLNKLNSNNLTEAVLRLRYIPQLNAAAKRQEGLLLSNRDLEDLNLAMQQARQSNDSCVIELVNAILKTNAFFEIDAKNNSFCLKLGSLIDSHKRRLDNKTLKLSDVLRSEWKSECENMLSIINKNYSDSVEHIEDEAKLYEDLKNLYAEISKKHNVALQALEKSLREIEAELTPKSTTTTTPEEKPLPTLQNKGQKGQKLIAFETFEIPKIEDLQFVEKSSAIKIEQKQNSTVEKVSLETTKESQQSIKIPYTGVHARVLLWHTNPEEAFKDLCEKYNSYATQKFSNLMRIYHAFSPAVDFFIDSLAIKCAWGKDEGASSYNIPGEIVDGESKTTKRGVFTYGVSKDGLLYHRCFTEQPYDKIANFVETRTYDALFPVLGSTKGSGETKFTKVAINDCKDRVKQNGLYVEIADQSNNITIRLYKVKSATK